MSFKWRAFYLLLSIIETVLIIPLSNYYIHGQNLQSNDNNSFISELPPNFEIPPEFRDSLPSSSNHPLPEFFSDLNLSKFFDFESPSPSITDFEAPEIYFPDKKNTFTNSGIGFQVELPKDWKGKEIKFRNNMVFAAPQDINLEKLEEPGTLRIISWINHKYVDR